MNSKDLFTGIGLLFAAYFIYRHLKKRDTASEKNNWDGPIPSLYVQGWGVFVLCIMGGIILILKSLPTRI